MHACAVKFICYVSSHKKYILNYSYTNDANNLLKTILVTITYNYIDCYFRYIYVF
jgi:hypothetical protein